MMFQFGPLSQVKRHLIFRLCVSTTQLFISQFAVINTCDCCHYTKLTQVHVLTQVLIDSNLNTMLFLSFGQTDKANSADPDQSGPRGAV